MTRIFDFAYPEITTTDLIKELLFIKTDREQMSISVSWFIITAIYLLLMNVYSVYLLATFQVFSFVKIYTIMMGFIFICRLLLGYILEIF